MKMANLLSCVLLLLLLNHATALYIEGKSPNAVDGADFVITSLHGEPPVDSTADTKESLMQPTLLGPITDGRMYKVSPSSHPTCANGLPIVNCLVSPCSVNKCPSDSTCVDDYCGGCKFVCKPKSKPPAPITLRPSSHSQDLCPNGLRFVNCRVSPCKVNSCPSNKECVEDYCGGCKFICKPKAVIKPAPATPRPNSNSQDLCPNGLPIVNCLVSPCKVNTCPSNTECVEDYCGGCNFACKPKAATKPTPTPQKCPDGKPFTQCKMAPCMTARCTAETTCVNDYCGGCYARCVKTGELRGVSCYTFIISMITRYRRYACHDGITLLRLLTAASSLLRVCPRGSEQLKYASLPCG